MHYFSTLFIFLFSLLIGFLSSGESLSLNDYSLIYYAICLSFSIHWLAFLPSYIYKTEKFYDFIGMLTYISVLGMVMYSKYIILGKIDVHSMILSILILVWTLRLGLFLFYRISKVGKNHRFTLIKQSFSHFLFTWTLSAAWVSLSMAAALTVLTSNIDSGISFFTYFGIILWCFGFVFEVVADFQKTLFKNNIDNCNKFITSGLWSLSRHPNYFGEIILWIGIAIIAFPLLSGYQYISLISPIFVYFLLTSISGINLLEQKAEQKWSDLDTYQKYKNKTPMLIPKFWN